MVLAIVLRETSHVTSANLLIWKIFLAWSEASLSSDETGRNFLPFATNSTIQTKINYGLSYSTS